MTKDNVTKIKETKPTQCFSYEVTMLVHIIADDEATAKSWINDELTWNDVYSKKPVEYLEAIAQGKTPRWDSEKGGYVYGDNEELTTSIGRPSKVTFQDLQSDSEVDTELPF